MKYLPVKKTTLAAAMALWVLGPISANAETIEFDFNFSTAGSGTLDYDDVLETTVFTFDFGGFGGLSSSFGTSLTASVFGAPPLPAVKQDNTFFALPTGPAQGLRLSSDGTFCVRPDADICGAPGGGGADLAFGTYNIALSITSVDVSINIKPGSDPNSINTCSGGTTPVTIFGSLDLDVATIDPTSLILASANVKLVGKSNRILCSIEDIGSVDTTFIDDLDPAVDGEPDLTCHFVTFALTDLTDNSTTADLTGNGCDSATPFPDCSGVAPAGLFDFVGSDSVNIVKDCP